MEQKNRELIRERITQLVIHTNCNTNLIAFFQQKNILKIYDVEEIAAKNAGEARATEFYKIIKTRVGAFQVLLQALEKYRQINALRVLLGKAGDKIKLSRAEVKVRVAKLLREHPSSSSVSFNVAPPVHLFSGRGKELEELHEMVLKSKESATSEPSQPVIIGGPKGIGKTQLARQYVNEKGSEFDNVIWLDAESENSLAKSFQNLAIEKLKIQSIDVNGNEKDGKALAKEVYIHFKGSFVLFIFDNGRTGSCWLRNFLPDLSENEHFYTLMTSKGIQWGSEVNVLNLKGLEKEDAVEMVKMGLKIEKNDSSQDEEDILELAEILGFIPAHLHDAVENIFDRNITDKYSIRDYIFEIKSKKRKLLEE